VEDINQEGATAETEAALQTPVADATINEAPIANAEADAPAGIKPRMGFKGKVVRTDLGGAFLDLGNGSEGYMHISQFLDKGAITRVADVVKVDDEMDVYVMSVNPKTKRINLTQHKPPTFDWSDLNIGRKIENVKVVAVESFGAFVDIDGPKHALLPFNLMTTNERPKVGQLLETVWVMESDEGRRRIGLTMVEPPKLPWEAIHRGDRLSGPVVRIERNGAYVEVGAEREGLISTRSFGAGWVNVGDFVEVGETVQVKVIGVDPSRKRLDLQLEGLKAEDFALSSGPAEEEQISPMAAALQKAQRANRFELGAENARNNLAKNKKQNQQKELLERTLQQMQATKK